MSYIYVLENMELYTSTCSWEYKLSNGVLWSIVCNLKFKLCVFKKAVSHLIGVDNANYPAFSGTRPYGATFLKIIRIFRYTHGSNPFFFYKLFRLFIVLKNEKGRFILNLWFRNNFCKKNTTGAHGSNMYVHTGFM